VFKNQQYFMVLKSNFGAFFQDTFFLCGITEALLGVLGIRDNWQNNFRDKG